LDAFIKIKNSSLNLSQIIASPLSSPASALKVATVAKKIFINTLILYFGYQLARYLWTYVSPPEAPDNQTRTTPTAPTTLFNLPQHLTPPPALPEVPVLLSADLPQHLTPPPPALPEVPVLLSADLLELDRLVVSKNPAKALQELLSIYQKLATPQCEENVFHYACLLYIHITERGTMQEISAVNGLNKINLQGKKSSIGQIYKVQPQLFHYCTERHFDYSDLYAKKTNLYQVAVVEKYFHDMGLTQVKRDPSNNRMILLPTSSSFVLTDTQKTIEINFEKELEDLNLPFEKRGNHLLPLQKKDGVSSPSISPLYKHVKDTSKKLTQIQAGLERYRDPEPKLPLDENGEASLPIPECYLKDISREDPTMTGKMYVDPLTNFVADPNTGQFKDCNAKKDVTEETLKWHLTISPTSLTTYRLSMPPKDMTIKKLYSMFMLLEAAENTLSKESPKRWNAMRTSNNFPLSPLDNALLGAFTDNQGILDISHKEMGLVHTILHDREELIEKFQEVLRDIFLNDHFEIMGGLKPLSDFLQKDPARQKDEDLQKDLAQKKTEDFMKKHGISVEVAEYIESEKGCLMLPSAIQVQTYSTTMMSFLETLFSNLRMEAANRQPKTFLTDTRAVGLWHASNIGMGQVKTLNIALEMILAMLKKKRQEESDFQFENYGDFIKMYASNEIKRINQFFVDLSIPAGAVNQSVLHKLDGLSSAKSLQEIQGFKREALQLFFKNHLSCSDSVWRNPASEEATSAEMDMVLIAPVQNQWEALDAYFRHPGRTPPPQVLVMKRLFGYFENSGIYKSLKALNQQDFETSYTALKKAACNNAFMLPEHTHSTHYGTTPFNTFILHFQHSLYKLHLMSENLAAAREEDRPQLETKHKAALDKVLAIFIKNKDKGTDGKTGWEACSNGFAAEFQSIHDAISSDGTDPTLACKLEFFETLCNSILNSSWTGLSFSEGRAERRTLVQKFKNSVSKEIGLGMDPNATNKLEAADTVPLAQAKATVAFIKQNLTSYELFIGFYDQLLSDLLVAEKSQENPTSLLLSPAFAGLTTQATLEALFFDPVEGKWDYLGLKEWLPLEMTKWLVGNGTLVRKVDSSTPPSSVDLRRVTALLTTHAQARLLKAQTEGEPFRQRSMALSIKSDSDRNISPWACLFPTTTSPAKVSSPAHHPERPREPYYPDGAAAAAPAVQATSCPAIAFGKAKWQQYFGIQVVEPPLPADIEAILAGPCPIFSGKRVRETHFLTLIPEGMTLERLKALAGNQVGFEHEYDFIWSQHCRTSSGRAHWVLMTNDVIPQSRNKGWEMQQHLAGNFKREGYELLSVIEAATCILLEYVQRGHKFYTREPCTYTRCIEQVQVGLFTKRPLAIGSFPLGRVDVTEKIDCESVGVGVARKFH
jgi:hypothetical protein